MPEGRRKPLQITPTCDIKHICNVNIQNIIQSKKLRTGDESWIREYDPETNRNGTLQALLDQRKLE